ncbi:response regulator [Roseiterribacter gracilis]|uniref:Response regulator n=1 Tax=Roseiterribacter gracilis TaxID=2812848 RepID=A0A8S8XJ66_9PROT|nr:response regulator [Rhodospirillales bacterium TMPK1]
MLERPRVLYVEDEPDIQTIARLALETIGRFVVEMCGSGEAALAAAKTGERFDLVLLDVMMPGIDGPTTLQRLREIPGFETVPVVFMTAKVQPDEIKRWRELGAVDVFEKPFDPMSLAARVGEVLGRTNRQGAA